MITRQAPSEMEVVDGRTVVTLRTQGCARVVSSIFLLLWIGPWAVGEYFALTALAAFAGVAIPFPLPVPVADGLHPISLLPIVFLAAWLAFWTWGGVSAMLEVIRLWFGRDVFTIGQGEMHLVRNFGLFSRSMSLSSGEEADVVLRRRGQALMLKRGRSTRLLTSLGSAGERRWLRDEIRNRLQLRGNLAAAESLPDHEITSRQDGMIVISHSPGSNRKARGCGFVILGLLATPILYLATSFSRETGEASPLLFLMGTVLSLVGIYCLAAREEWIIGPNHYEHRRSVGPWTVHSPIVRDATLHLKNERDSDGDDVIALELRTPHGRPKTIRSAIDEPDEPLNWGRLLERHTRWQLHIDSSVVD